jgi:hypothetical protein
MLRMLLASNAKRHLFAACLMTAACGGATNSGGSTGAGGAPGPGICDGRTLLAPIQHRPSSVTCPATPPSSAACEPMAVCAVAVGTLGAPLSGSCDGGSGGTTACGRCEATDAGGTVCRIWECTADTDCSGRDVCSCKGMTRGFGGSSFNNQCVHSNCQSDADCATGFCSPTVSADCGPFYGVQGYYCHTCDDACTNDADCPPNGYCAYQPSVGHWACGYARCAG